MVEQRVDGIILKPTAFIRPGALEALNVPVVLFWHAMPDDLSYIEVDHEAGSRMAVRHLIERGYRADRLHRRPGNSPSNQIRLLAYQQTLQEAGLTVDPQPDQFWRFQPWRAATSGSPP